MKATSEPFVRREMLAPSSPPITEAGAVKWLRENLFSSPLNVVLTVLGVGAFVYLVTHIAPWMLRGVWNAGSLTECRQILEARYGEGVTGACWAVIRERWPQYLFGFYPAELYWRPVLAFVLLLVAVAPVLFDKLPRQMLWFALVYPAVGFWLLWGGTIWVPVMAMLGFVIGYVAAKVVQPVAGTILATIAAVVAPVLWWLFLAGPAATTLQSIIPIAMQEVRSREFGGFILAFTIGFTGIAFSLPLGVMLALGRQSDMFIVNKLSVGFIEFIRGVPLITLLFTASLLLNYFLPPGTDFDIILRVIIMVVLFAAAYIAEVIRGGLAALPRGQYEAADALGLDYWKGIYWEPYIFVGAIFFIICFSMSRYSMYLERKLKTDHR